MLPHALAHARRARCCGQTLLPAAGADAPSCCCCVRCTAGRGIAPGSAGQGAHDRLTTRTRLLATLPRMLRMHCCLRRQLSSESCWRSRRCC